MVQWVKNLTAVDWLSTEVWVLSLAQCSGFKDPALLQLWQKSQLWLGFNPWPGYLHMPKKRKKREREEKKSVNVIFLINRLKKEKNVLITSQMQRSYLVNFNTNS